MGGRNISIIKYEVGNNTVVQMQSTPDVELSEVDAVLSSWKNVFSFNVEDVSFRLRPAQLGALFSIKSHWIVSNEPATVCYAYRYGQNRNNDCYCCIRSDWSHLYYCTK